MEWRDGGGGVEIYCCGSSTGRRVFRETYATRGAARMSGRAARAERAIVQVMIRRAARSPEERNQKSCCDVLSTSPVMLMTDLRGRNRTGGRNG